MLHANFTFVHPSIHLPVHHRLAVTVSTSPNLAFGLWQSDCLERTQKKEQGEHETELPPDKKSIAASKSLRRTCIFSRVLTKPNIFTFVKILLSPPWSCFYNFDVLSVFLCFYLFDFISFFFLNCCWICFIL